MKQIFVAGHNGMVGSAICRKLRQNADYDVITAPRESLDLTNQAQVVDFFKQNKFDEVYLAAARVGGIHANNTYPAEFIHQNLSIQTNIIDAAFKAGVEKLLFLGSSCIYPKFAPQPMSEVQLLNGALEPTNEPYAIAKIAGIKMCESYNRQYATQYRSVMPTNLYGPGDNFHPENSHVIPALLRRIHEAKTTRNQTVDIWGSGEACREFLHVDDMADACVYVMNLNNKDFSDECQPMLSHLNIGTGVDCSIKELVEKIVNIIGYTGKIRFDYSRPDGAPRKLLDVSKLRRLGWASSIPLDSGLRQTYDWFLQNSWRG